MNSRNGPAEGSNGNEDCRPLDAAIPVSSIILFPLYSVIFGILPLTFEGLKVESRREGRMS
jgi:hypothetical protein